MIEIHWTSVRTGSFSVSGDSTTEGDGGMLTEGGIGEVGEVAISGVDGGVG